MFIRSLLLPALLLAGATVASAQMKVAIINLQRAVLDTAELTKAQKDLEAKFKPRQDQMEAIQKELQQIQTQLQTMQGKLTPAAEQELTVRGQRRQRELQRMTEDLQGDVDRERQDVLGRSAKRMEDVVKKVSEAGGYDVVIDVTNAVFFKPALEITKLATEEYNKAYPVQ
jgi:outer membrane protein